MHRLVFEHGEGGIEQQAALAARLRHAARDARKPILAPIEAEIILEPPIRHADYRRVATGETRTGSGTRVTRRLGMDLDLVVHAEPDGEQAVVEVGAARARQHSALVACRTGRRHAGPQ